MKQLFWSAPSDTLLTAPFTLNLLMEKLLRVFYCQVFSFCKSVIGLVIFFYFTENKYIWDTPSIFILLEWIR